MFRGAKGRPQLAKGPLTLIEDDDDRDRDHEYQQ